MVDRLDDRFRLLTTAQRDVPPRQRTLTAVIDWSWDLLDDAGPAWCSPGSRCSADGCTLEAAEAGLPTPTSDALARLVDRSLVVLDDAGAAPRYRLLESVAAFCAGAAQPTPTRSRARHAAYYTELAERADPQLRGADQREWLARLDAETANLRVGAGARRRAAPGRSR